MTASVTCAIDESSFRSAVTDTYDYDAFGNKINSTGTTPNNYLYRGEQYDADLGLYYLRARYYNPITGRFMSRDPEDGDPTDPATLHKYLYAEGDPVNGMDPTGRDATTAGGGLSIPNSPTNSDYGPLRPVGAVEYGLVVGAVSLGAVAGVRQFAEAVECSYEKLASNVKTLTQYMGSVTATSSLIPSGTCGSTGPDPCAPIERELEEAMGEVLARYQELLMDTNQLYCRAYDKPTLGRKKGYWLGHLKAFAEAQASLRRVIAKALAHGCPVPPRAWELSSPLLTPPPVCPAGRIPRP